MAVDDLEYLKSNLPEVFSEVLVPPDWDDDWIFIPIDDPEESGEHESLAVGIIDEPWLNVEEFSQAPVGALSQKTELTYGGPELSSTTSFGGAPQPRGWTSPMPPPDAFAFYLPFHYFYPTWWGVYIILENALVLARWLSAHSKGQLPVVDALTAVRIFLYAHEAFHHNVEAFATRLEVTHRTALYKTGFQRLFDRVRDDDACIEEMLATAHGYRRVKERFSKNDDIKLEAALEGLRWYIDQCPPGYRRAPEAFRSSDFGRYRSELAEANQVESLPHLPSKEGTLWHCFPHAFSGISRVTSRVNYAVRRSSPLATRRGLHLRYLRYRDLRERLLTVANCSPVREGKGSHEIWKNPSGQSFPVPRHPREITDALLASIIRQAGLKMSVSQFRSTRP